MANGTFASAENLTLSGLVLGTIILLNRMPVVWIRSTALVLALAVGYIAAAYMGRLDFTGAREAALFQIPVPLHFGLGFSWALFVPMLIIYLVTSLEAIGDVTATSKVSKQPVEGPLWMQRIKGGVLVNGANSLLAGVFNTFPSSVFAQNNGVIQLTGIASRHVGVWIAGMLDRAGPLPQRGRRAASRARTRPGRRRHGDVRRRRRVRHQHPGGDSVGSSCAVDHRGVSGSGAGRVASAGNSVAFAAYGEERAGIRCRHRRDLRAW